MIAARQLVIDLYAHLLRRTPREAELTQWTSILEAGEAFESVFYKFIGSAEYQRRQSVECKFPSGHFHSPVVNPGNIKHYVDWSSNQPIAAINLNLNEMQTFFEHRLDLFRSTRFPEKKTPECRYHLDGAPFPYGDALTLRGMIAEYQPKRIIEIGSGFSTAVMLDAAQDFQIRPRITCIEPYPNRLKSLLHESDVDMIELVERELQTVPLSTFQMLEANDILFIDSTHVLKTGSDVHYELFHILPTLKTGVLVHVHDIHFPFEYPARWIYQDNYSWNEIYALRAFLMYNSRFKIIFWGTYFRKQREAWLRDTFPQIINQNAGGSIWLQVVSS